MPPTGRKSSGSSSMTDRQVAASRVVASGAHDRRLGAGGGRLQAGGSRDGLVDLDNNHGGHGGLVSPNNSHSGRGGLGQAAGHGSQVAASGRGDAGTGDGGFLGTDGSSPLFPFFASTSSPWWDTGGESISPSFRLGSI